MKENGSPEAIFDFDEDRTYFRVIFPVHPRYRTLHAIREAAHLWVVGEKEAAIALLRRSLETQPGTGVLVNQLIEYAFAGDQLDLARRTMDRFEKYEAKTDASLPYLTMIRLLIDKKYIKEAEGLLNRIPSSKKISEIVETAILKKKTKDFQGAHGLFAEAHSIHPDEPKILQEFARTKLSLARKLWKRKDIQSKKRLNREAAELFRKAIQLTDDSRSEAWCWLDLARTLDWLRSPKSEVETAFQKALSLAPDEELFHKVFRNWKNKHQKRL